MIPVTFGGCAGWLHDGPGRRGIVLCGAFGFEDLCSHRALALLAAEIAAVGLPVLRFDYRGTGDSLDLVPDDAQLAAWTDDIEAALAWMRSEKSVGEVALVGLRLGAVLAARAATRHGGIDMLGLLAPVLSGRTYLRELRALSQLVAAPKSHDKSGDGGLETTGFCLPRTTVEALGALELDAGVQRPANRLLLMPARTSPGIARLEAGLVASGAEVISADFAGYDALMCDPTAAQVPGATLRTVTAWVTAASPPGTTPPFVQAPASLAGDCFCEERVFIGTDDMAAVFCRPAPGVPLRKAVIFLNAGAIHHIGWARMNVAMARQLAAAGIASLRVDLSGIGDSLTGASGLYGGLLQADVQAAVGWLTELGISDVTVFGICSGAYQAFHAALGDSRIRGLVLVNQLVFNWGPTYAMQLGAWRATKAALVAAGTQDIAVDAEADLEEAAGMLAKLLPLARKLARNSFGALMNLSAMAAAVTQKNVVADWFDTLSRQGTRILLVYSAGDLGLQELERHMGGTDGWRALALPNVSRKIIADADHAMTPSHARRELAAALEQFIAGGNAGTVAQQADAEAA